MVDALLLLPWLVAPPLAVAAIADLATRTIPDSCAIATGAFGLLLQGLGGGVVAALVALVLATVVFGAGLLLWRRGWLGGGDVKLLAAAALTVPAGAVGALLLAVALAGGGLSALYLVLRASRPHLAATRPVGRPARLLRAEVWRIRRGGPLPYGVAIAAGTLFTLAGGAA